MKWVESKDVGGQLLVWVKAPNTDHWFLLWEALSWYPTSLGETKMGKMQFLKVQSLSTLVCSWCFSWPVWEHTNHNLQFPPLQRFLLITLIFQGGFPGGSVVKNPPANAGDVGSVPRLGRCPGKGHGNPLQYSCLENPMDWGAWRATVHGFAESDTTTKQQQSCKRGTMGRITVWDPVCLSWDLSPFAHSFYKLGQVLSPLRASLSSTIKWEQW